MSQSTESTDKTAARPFAFCYGKLKSLIQTEYTYFYSLDTTMSRKAIIAIALLISASLNYASALPREARIIGGEPANPAAWPWMSGLVEKNTTPTNQVFCGASLIAKNWVLTAAHCVIDEDISTFDIIINKSQLASSGGERLTAERIIMHPQYDDFTLENDLALIKLATPSNNAPIKILSPFTTQDYGGKPAIALGWGTLSATSDVYPSELHQVDLPIIGTARCGAAMGDITNDMLCAGEGLGKKDTCFGDSGGPLIIFDTESNSWRQAGITSWGFDCAEPGFFGVYTRLKNYAEFISDHLCSAGDALPPPTLQLSLTGNRVDLNWNSPTTISGYRLNYAPYPQAQVIYSLDMNRLTSYSVELGTGSAFYVAITSYQDNCLSGYSNIENFTIK